MNMSEDVGGMEYSGTGKGTRNIDNQVVKEIASSSNLSRDRVNSVQKLRGQWEAKVNQHQSNRSIFRSGSGYNSTAVVKSELHEQSSVGSSSLTATVTSKINEKQSKTLNATAPTIHEKKEDILTPSPTRPTANAIPTSVKEVDVKRPSDMYFDAALDVSVALDELNNVFDQRGVQIPSTKEKVVDNMSANATTDVAGVETSNVKKNTANTSIEKILIDTENEIMTTLREFSSLLTERELATTRVPKDPTTLTTGDLHNVGLMKKDESIHVSSSNNTIESSKLLSTLQRSDLVNVNETADSVTLASNLLACNTEPCADEVLSARQTANDIMMKKRLLRDSKLAELQKNIAVDAVETQKASEPVDCGSKKEVTIEKRAPHNLEPIVLQKDSEIDVAVIQDKECISIICDDSKIAKERELGDRSNNLNMLSPKRVRSAGSSPPPIPVRRIVVNVSPKAAPAISPKDPPPIPPKRIIKLSSKDSSASVSSGSVATGNVAAALNIEYTPRLDDYSNVKPMDATLPDIFHATYKANGQVRVLKRLYPADIMTAPTMDWFATVRRVVGELRIMSHSAVASVSDAWQEDAYTGYVAMPRYADFEGGLGAWLTAVVPIDTDNSDKYGLVALRMMHVRRFLYSLLQAVSYIHERGIVHGHLCESVLIAGIKPGKVTAAASVPDVRPVVVGLRYGLALSTVNDTNAVAVPPELLKSSLPATCASDVWSIGAIIFKAISDQWPKGGEAVSASLCGGDDSLAHLLYCMLQCAPYGRPTASFALMHPCFFGENNALQDPIITPFFKQVTLCRAKTSLFERASAKSSFVPSCNRVLIMDVDSRHLVATALPLFAAMEGADFSKDLVFMDRYSNGCHGTLTADSVCFRIWSLLAISQDAAFESPTVGGWATYLPRGDLVDSTTFIGAGKLLAKCLADGRRIPIALNLSVFRFFCGVPVPLADLHAYDPAANEDEMEAVLVTSRQAQLEAFRDGFFVGAAAAFPNIALSPISLALLCAGQMQTGTDLLLFFKGHVTITTLPGSPTPKLFLEYLKTLSTPYLRRFLYLSSDHASTNIFRVSIGNNSDYRGTSNWNGVRDVRVTNRTPEIKLRIVIVSVAPECSGTAVCEPGGSQSFIVPDFRDREVLARQMNAALSTSMDADHENDSQQLPNTTTIL